MEVGRKSTQVIEGVSEEVVRQRLEETYTTEEVSKSLKKMGFLKAPGSDDFQALFLKKTWCKTGPALSNFFLGVLKRKEVLEEAAIAYWCLSPRRRDKTQ